MINTDYFTRKPIHRLVDYLYNQERNHLIECYFSDDMAETVESYTDQELFDYCVANDIDDIWLDCYMVRTLITEEDEDLEDV